MMAKIEVLGHRQIVFMSNQETFIKALQGNWQREDRR